MASIFFGLFGKCGPNRNQQTQLGQNPHHGHHGQHGSHGHHGQHGHHGPPGAHGGAPPLSPRPEEMGFFLNNGIRLVVRAGDITALEGGAVVAGENNNFTGGGAIAKALLRKGGERYFEARRKMINDYWDRHPCRDIVLHCPAGDHLAFMFVFHALLTFHTDRSIVTMNSFEQLVDIYGHVLGLARKLKITSIVTPLLGSGASGGRLDDCLKAAFVAISNQKDNLIDTITIVEYDQVKAQVIRMQLKDRIERLALTRHERPAPPRPPHPPASGRTSGHPAPDQRTPDHLRDRERGSPKKNHAPPPPSPGSPQRVPSGPHPDASYDRPPGPEGGSSPVPPPRVKGRSDAKSPRGTATDLEGNQGYMESAASNRRDRDEEARRRSGDIPGERAVIDRSTKPERGREIPVQRAEDLLNAPENIRPSGNKKSLKENEGGADLQVEEITEWLNTLNIKDKPGVAHRSLESQQHKSGAMERQDPMYTASATATLSTSGGAGPVQKPVFPGDMLLAEAYPPQALRYPAGAGFSGDQNAGGPPPLQNPTSTSGSPGGYAGSGYPLVDPHRSLPLDHQGNVASTRNADGGSLGMPQAEQTSLQQQQPPRETIATYNTGGAPIATMGEQIIVRPPTSYGESLRAESSGQWSLLSNVSPNTSMQPQPGVAALFPSLKQTPQEQQGGQQPFPQANQEPPPDYDDAEWKEPNVHKPRSADNALRGESLRTERLQNQDVRPGLKGGEEGGSFTTSPDRAMAQLNVTGQSAPSFNSGHHYSSSMEASEQGQNPLPPDSLEDFSFARNMRSEGGHVARFSVGSPSSELHNQGMDRGQDSSEQGRAGALTTSHREAAGRRMGDGEERTSSHAPGDQPTWNDSNSGSLWWDPPDWCYLNEEGNSTAYLGPNRDLQDLNPDRASYRGLQEYGAEWSFQNLSRSEFGATSSIEILPMPSSSSDFSSFAAPTSGSLHQAIHNSEPEHPGDKQEPLHEDEGAEAKPTSDTSGSSPAGPLAAAGATSGASISTAATDPSTAPPASATTSSATSPASAPASLPPASLPSAAPAPPAEAHHELQDLLGSRRGDDEAVPPENRPTSAMENPQGEAISEDPSHATGQPEEGNSETPTDSWSDLGPGSDDASSSMVIVPSEQEQGEENEEEKETRNQEDEETRRSSMGEEAPPQMKDEEEKEKQDEEELVQAMPKETMPEGKMVRTTKPNIHLEGFSPDCGTIVIEYSFSNGIQGPQHPAPGQPYKGTFRRAFLPDNQEGRRVLQLLQTAFDRKLTFHLVQNADNQEWRVEFTDIPHKTSLRGGPAGSSYPDPEYLSRLRQVLEGYGIK